MRAIKRLVLGATLVMAFAASLAFGEHPTPCHEEYLASGLAQQQMGFGEFRELYGDDVCDERSEREDHR